MASVIRSATSAATLELRVIDKIVGHVRYLSWLSASKGLAAVVQWEILRMAARLGLCEDVRVFEGLKKSAGLFAAMRWEVIRFAVRRGYREPAVWSLHPRQVSYPLTARLHGSSDMDCFNQIFVVEEYSGLRDLTEPSLVLDLGANVGFSSAYLLSAFPNARVIAVEPDERNIAICKANLSPYGHRVLLLHGAVWSTPKELRLIRGNFGDRRDWATQVGELIEHEESATHVQAWDVASLIEMSRASAVDLLKVDIDRSELCVFDESARGWLPKIRNICIELHGADCKEAFFVALKEFNYELQYSGEFTICRNLRPKESAPVLKRSSSSE